MEVEELSLDANSTWAEEAAIYKKGVGGLTGDRRDQITELDICSHIFCFFSNWLSAST